MNLADKDGQIWFDGRLIPWREATVHVLSHSLHYGTGVFEGVRAYATDNGPALFRLLDHTKRLLNSARIIGLPVIYSCDELCAAQLEVVAANGLSSAYVRPLMFLGPESLSIDIRKNSLHTIVAAWTWGPYLGEEGLRKGIRVRTSSFPRPHPAATMCRAKVTGNYVNSTLAHSEVVAEGYDEALQLDTEGFVAEGSGENLFLVRDGTLVTPALHAVLPGITRQTVIELAAEAGIACVDKRLTRDDVYCADEVFFSGTAAEITPIREVDRRLIGFGTRGPITEQLQQLFFNCVGGRDSRHSEWLTLVDESSRLAA